MESHRLIKRDRAGRAWWRWCTVSVRLNFAGLAVSEDVVENLWVRIRGMGNK